MKKFILLFLLLVSTLIMFGQKKPVEKATTVGVNILVPAGSLSDTNPYGLGMSIESEIVGKKNVGLTLNTGYNYYKGDEESKSIIHLQTMPAGMSYISNPLLRLNMYHNQSWDNNIQIQLCC